MLSGFVFTGGAAANGVEARLDRLTELAEQRGVGAELRKAAETPALADLDSNLRTGLGKNDRRSLALLLALTSPRMSRVHARLSAGQKLSGPDRAFLARTAQRMARNPVIAGLRRRGIALKRRGAELKRLWRRLPGPSRASSSATPAGASIEAATADLNQPVRALGGRSIAASGAALLKSPAGYRYVRDLPSVALAMLFPAGGRGGARASGLCASGSIGPSVTTMLNFELEEVIGQTVAETAGKQVGTAVYWDSTFGTRARAWRTFTAVNRFREVLESVSTGEKLAEAAWNAVLKCGAESVQLVPEQAQRAAGQSQSYSLLARDSKGSSWGGIRIDGLAMSGGSCDSEAQACTGTTAGDQRVVASFGGLKAPGKLTVTPGAIAHLDLGPDGAMIDPGEESPAYRVTATDRFGNIVTTHFGAEPTGTHLEISPDGSCNQASGRCRPAAGGRHTVEAVTNAAPLVISSVRLNVRGGDLALTPAETTIRTGESQSYSVSELTPGGTPVRTVSFGSGDGQATLSISPDGSCDQAAGTCAPAHAGPHLVTATTSETSGEASLEVEARELTISPATLESAVPTRWYAEKLEMVGAEGEVEWQISGIPPSGIEFLSGDKIGAEDLETGFPPSAALLAGSPSVLGTSGFTVDAEDAAGNYAHRTFSLTSKAPCAGTCAEAGPFEQVTVAWTNCGCGIGAGNYYYLRPVVNGVALEMYVNEWLFDLNHLYAGPGGRVWATMPRGITGPAGSQFAMEINYGEGPIPEGETWEEFVDSLHPLGGTNAVTVRH